MEDKREKLKYKIAKDLYKKASDSIDDQNKDALLHPIDWLNDKDKITKSWKEYLATSNYRQDDPFSQYMNFMCKSYNST